MKTLEKIIELYSEENFLKADGFDDCIIGICEDFNSPLRLVYSVKFILNTLQKDENMTYEEARDYYDFNIKGGYVGEKTPVWCEDDF